MSAPGLQSFKMYMRVCMCIFLSTLALGSIVYTVKSVNSRESKFDHKIEEPAFDPLLSVYLSPENPSLILKNPINEIFFMNKVCLYVCLSVSL